RSSDLGLHPAAQGVAVRRLHLPDRPVGRPRRRPGRALHGRQLRRGRQPVGDPRGNPVGCGDPLRHRRLADSGHGQQPVRRGLSVALHRRQPVLLRLARAVRRQPDALVLMADGSASARIAASPARRCFDLRAVALPLHRHMGLALAGFLILSGLPGSILVFQRGIDAAINPGLWAASEGGPRLSPDQIAARIEAWDPRVRARWIPIEDGKAPDVWVDPKIDPATGAPFAVPFNQVFVDPVSGAINGSRPYGGWPPTVETLIPFTDMFHRNMMIPGMWGTWLMGAVGLIWFFDSITGAYLTFPRGRPFFRKWRPAWAIKADA